MTSKAEELWFKYADDIDGGWMERGSFLAALREYGAEVRKRDAEIARVHEAQGVACSAAIEREELP